MFPKTFIKDSMSLIGQTWDQSIVPSLMDYIKIPNKSPMFDKDWQKNGYMQQAVTLIRNWCQARPITGLHIEIVHLENRTPLIYMEVPGQIDETVLLYGHLDKQPEMTGWSDGLDPWQPVLRDGKLYGRGGADDGYSAFASLNAIEVLQAQGIAHPRCVIIIEACEESGSYDLPYYITYLQTRIGTPSLVICLDSGCGNYEQLWMTTSLRGLISGQLHVQVLDQGVHSGQGTGITASSFRILRDLLSRIEDAKTGEILLPELHVNIPTQRIEQIKVAAQILGKSIYEDLPFSASVKPISGELDELLTGKTWKPGLEITGIDGIPALQNAGNVLRPYTSATLSMRIPAHCDPEKAAQAMKQMLEKDPPYQAKVSFKIEKSSAGWDSPALAPWLEQACKEASQGYFNKDPGYWGEGGSIPFMGMLGEKFPQAQFMITGVLGPHSNAHGPNEFLHIEMGKRLTGCVAYVLAKCGI